MPISPLGQLNTTALTVADVYVQIIPPQLLLNGVPSNIGGYVGSASWGPVNQPVIVGSYQEYAQNFGALVARAFDMGTHIAVLFQEGGSAAKCVRVTDGTDVAATAIVLTNCLTLTSKYTGSGGNSIKFTISTGSKPSTFMLRVSMPGQLPEVFDNIGGTGNAFWVAAAAAINNGITNGRGHSQIIVAAAGAGVTAPSAGTTSLAGGSDGATTINATALLGADTFPRTGMYALRDQDVSVLVLCDLTDTSSWGAQDAFCQSEGIYGITTGPASQSITAAVTAKNTAAIDTYALKIMIGDWIFWFDSVNGIERRLISPQAHAAAKLLSLAPQYSGLNKRILTVVSTEKQQTGIPYTAADIQTLVLAGIDVICAPNPGGNYFALRTGHNASSNAVIHGDNYTRMTNYIAATLEKGMGLYVGELQSSKPNDETRRKAKVTLDAFMAAMVQQNQIDNFKNVLDLSNNPLNRQALGYMQADCKVRYLSVVEFFVINLEGGQSVTIDVQPGQSTLYGSQAATATF